MPRTRGTTAVLIAAIMNIMNDYIRYCLKFRERDREGGSALIPNPVQSFAYSFPGYLKQKQNETEKAVSATRLCV